MVGITKESYLQNCPELSTSDDYYTSVFLSAKELPTASARSGGYDPRNPFFGTSLYIGPPFQCITSLSVFNLPFSVYPKASS